ncbi:MAG: hypothetical protein IJ338_09505 [Bacteroidaceae bacterium]|nr:hypothetical protein [Bacteroidaceae bacterium]
MRKYFHLNIWSFFVLFILFVSCSDDDKGKDVDVPSPKAQHTVFMYMAVDNSLYSETSSVLNKLLRGVNISGLNDCNLVVYLDNWGELPRLMEVRIGESGRAEWRTVNSYNEQDSSSPEVLGQIIEEVSTRYPSDSYSLIISSHGMGWIPIVDSYTTRRMSDAEMLLPDGISFLDTSVATRAFIQDKSNWMEIDEFCRAVPDRMFDFILFDACYMGSVEIAYALRNKTDYLIFSPAEVLAEGFPYHLLMSDMLTPNPDLQAICEGYFNYYANKTGTDCSATIALVDCSQMDALASTVRDVLLESETGGAVDDYLQVQRYDRLSARILFDLDDYMSRIGVSAYSRFVSQLAKTVIYKAATPSMLIGSSGFYINHYSGLSTYIWQNKYQTLNSVYSQLEWYRAVYGNQ